jgi:hypothetical protein
VRNHEVPVLESLIVIDLYIYMSRANFLATVFSAARPEKAIALGMISLRARHAGPGIYIVHIPVFRFITDTRPISEARRSRSVWHHPRTGS